MQEVKDYIAEALNNFIDLTKEHKTLNIQDTDELVQAINFAYETIENLEKELDIVRQNSYNYMEKYTWLLAHCPPKAVAVAAGFPWENLENPSSVASHMDRIEQYVEYGIQNLKLIAETQKNDGVTDNG